MSHLRFSKLSVVASFSLLGGCAGALPLAEMVLTGSSTMSDAVRCRQIEEYPLGTRVAGELTVSDCKTDGLDRQMPTDLYQFSTTEQRDVVFALETPGKTGNLHLLTRDGDLLEEAASAGGFGTLRTQVAPGTYRVQVRLSAGTEERPYTGRYTLTSSTDQIGYGGCSSIADLSPGATIQGSWSVADCKRKVGPGSFGYADYYLLQVDRPRDLTLAGTSAVGQPDLFLGLRDGTVLHQGEVRNDGTVLQTQLAPGTYVVGIAPNPMRSEAKTGPYSLSVR